MKELFWFLIIIIFCFCLIMVFLYILIFLYKRFGIIGLKEKDFKKSHIFSDENNKPSNYLDIYNYYYYNLSRNRFDISMIFSMNEVYKKIIQNTWYEKTNKTLNLNNPLTFNEKMQWLKLYNSIPIKTILADKYLVREYIKNKIGAQYLIPLLGVYSKFEDINFAQLPNQFVIKCNHGSGFNIIVKDKSNLNMEIIKKQLDEWMGYNYGLSFKMELHYRDIQPKIIIEKYMDDGTGDLRDYKITCFNGKPEFLWIDINRHSEHKRNLYDLKGNQLPYEFNTKYKSIPLSEKPKQLRQLLKLASILSKNFLFARIDFYLVDQRIYFGEITFTPGSGYLIITPRSFEKRLSSLIKLPKLAYNVDIGEYYMLENPLKTKFNLVFPIYLFEISLIIYLIYYLFAKLKIIKLIKK